MQTIPIQARKYGGIPHYEWETTLIEATGEYVLVKGERLRKLVHHSKGKTFIVDNPTLEFLPLNQWFTASVQLHPNGALSYYCNICMPPADKNGFIEFIDLDIDIIKQPGGDWEVVDEDEFREHAIKFGYPAELIARTESERDLLLRLIKERNFPFDGWLEAKVQEFLSV
ncbi:DUF402 domain-containing protein [Paenibacillus pasadenensis]|uniref:DUF402 domain-containing protein n=1 Tax=Paenibacillus pasadenensis TaxID=217090 RepID=UPI002041778F|nr:DUF402 domain-containing protein [Paenibacillus pasadenensis]MCM3749447.1 DUF402 domain-containing protein [Paenibacillus pasadenensis]